MPLKVGAGWGNRPASATLTTDWVYACDVAALASLQVLSSTPGDATTGMVSLGYRRTEWEAGAYS